MTAQQPPQKSNGRAVPTIGLDSLFRILNTVLSGLLMVVIVGMFNMASDLRVIQSNRFTSNDWLREKEALRREMPPPEWRERINELEDQVEEMEDALILLRGRSSPPSP